MAMNADQGARTITRFNGRRLRLACSLIATCVAGIGAVAVIQASSQALAQEGVQPAQVQPLGSEEPGQSTTDPITNKQIELLQESGLIDEQSKVSEGLLLMARQLQQAQLVGQLLDVLGPDAMIEVTPGEFKSFANTPAGLQGRIDYLELMGQLQEARGGAGSSGGFDTFSGTGVNEIYGRSGDLSAVITVDGQQNTVATGDQLEDGTQVLSITTDKVELQNPDGSIRVLNAP